MIKREKKRQPIDDRAIFEKTKALFAEQPPQCTASGAMSDIDAYIKNTGSWSTIATVYSANGIDAQDIADFIVNAVKYYVLYLSGENQK